MKNPSHRLLLLLLSADFVFIVLDLLYRYSSFISFEYFCLNQDRGYSEVFQYIKIFWIALLLFAVFLRTRQGIFLLLALLFGYLFVDDAFSVHGNLGLIISDRWQWQPLWGLRARDFGELFVSFTIGSVFLSLGWLLYPGSAAFAQKIGRNFVKLIILLAVFGIGADMANIISGTSLVGTMTAILDDGGEMIIMSLILGYTFSLTPPEDLGAVSS